MPYKAPVTDFWIYVPRRAYLPAMGLLGALAAVFWKKECFLRPKKGTDLQKNTEFIILLYLYNAQSD